MIPKRYSFLVLLIASSLLGLVVSCAPSSTEGDLDITYPVGYAQGYETGYDDGYTEGHLIGKSESYETGYDDGYTEGHLIGKSESSDSFLPSNTDFVYITRTGTKYHRASCRYLSQSSIKVERAEAIGNFGACSVCDP